MAITAVVGAAARFALALDDHGWVDKSLVR
jgi:hypothetical protein